MGKEKKGFGSKEFYLACNKKFWVQAQPAKIKRLLNGELKPKPELSHNTELKYNSKVLTELNYVKEWVTTKMPAIQF